MKTRPALLVVGVAATVGVVVGAFALPDRGVAVGGGSSPSTTAPTSASPSGSAASTPPSTPTPTPTPTSTEGGPVTGTQLLTAADFRTVGLTVVPKRSDVRLEVVACGEPKTLDDVAVSGPPLQQVWEKGRVVASEQAVAARDTAEATVVARRVLRKLEACQVEVASHWVYGPTHTKRLGPEITASWLGEVDGTLNTTGTAPPGEKINGGIAVLRNGSRVAVFNISFCASAGDSPACVVAGQGAYEQLAALSRAAALRLG